MTVAFYINSFRPDDGFNASSLISGNPGLGGTEYMVMLISYLLQERNNDIDVIMLSSCGEEIEGFKTTKYTPNIKEAISLCEKEGVDYLIFCHDSKFIIDGSLSVKTCHTRLIPWCHNFITWKEADYYSKNESIWRIINVGKEQNELLIDHPIYSKSEYIFNSVNAEIKCDMSSERRNIVTYMGCIWPSKGFHWLSEVWKDIVSSVPDAELYVVGSSKLYGWGNGLGPLGITEKEYESYIVRPLIVDGHIMKSVHFMGKLGCEKNEILAKTKVGVSNPTGNTETFCITAVEMQLMGARVIMGRCPGSLDTVKNGRLIWHKKQLANAIIKELKADNNGSHNAKAHFEENFSHECIVKRWEALLIGDSLPKKPFNNLFYRLKWLKIAKHSVARVFPVVYKLPTVERILTSIERRYFRNFAKYLYTPYQ